MYWTLLIAGCAVVVTASAGQAQTTTAACAERDLRFIASIEERGEACDLPAHLLGELGLMQLQARFSCLAGDEAQALTIYDDILGAARIAERVGR